MYEEPYTINTSQSTKLCSFKSKFANSAILGGLNCRLICNTKGKIVKQSANPFFFVCLFCAIKLERNLAR